MSLPILYHDDDLVVVNKRAGLLVHRSAIARDAQEFALQMVRDQIGQMVYPVHRLDRATSGALIFALSSSSARILADQFSSCRVEKSYLAVVRGTPPDEILVDYPLKEDPDLSSKSEEWSSKPAQEAVTHFRTLATHEFAVRVDKFPTSRYSLIRALPKTGRKHQIRRHLRHLGHPIVGDVRYGSGKHNRFFRDSFHINGLLLACTQLSFKHPRDQRIVTVNAPLADHFRTVVTALQWGHHLEH